MDNVPQEVLDNRQFNYDIDPLIKARWSPRAMTGEPIEDDELMSLFEAARWAPSSFPWRFVYAKRDTEHWDKFFNFLMEGNQAWCANAAALVVIISKNTFDYNGKPSATAQFSTGAAWENLALQGTAQGLVVHGIGGFFKDKVKEELGVSDEFTVMAMCAVGKRADKSVLPEEAQKGEVPSDRKPLNEITFEGNFNK
jgi:nitroreductase